MGRVANKLSVKFIDRKDLKPGLYGDGGGLYLQVSNRNTRAWVFRFMIRGVARKMGLGDIDNVKLADARKKANAAHLLVIDGVDPIEQRNSRKAALAAERAKATTFKECAEGYIAANEMSWKSPKHANQWTATLERYAYPVIGSLPVGAIDEGHVMKILQPIWTTKTETASRVRGRIEKVLDRAKALKLRTGENPARWTGYLDQLLPRRAQVAPVEHHPAMPYIGVPQFMERLRSRNSISARALEWTILNACRTGDTIGAIRHEIRDGNWIVPAARLKGRKGGRKRDHVVPLSRRALELLEGLPKEGNFLFPGAKEGAGLSNMALAEVLKDLGVAPTIATVHGFRSTFKDWCSEQTAYPNEMSELALAHTVGDKVEAAYRRGDMREKRRQMMEDWAAFCAFGGVRQ
ncbi:tyrosine-type recombinase/integrase [Bradyrhizobium sp. 27S5]|uniref:tyrosine-type recombinase/integrase n=1 Tax=Bradyrhizobium sp. 27S5 TaxID=3139728 RepID=UPI0030CB256A